MAASSKKNETQIALSDGLTALKGIGPQKAERFKKLGIETFYDALSFYPREYEDYRNKKQIADLGNDDKAVVIARVLLARLGGGFGRNRTLHVLAEDSTGRMEVLFFQGAYFIKQFQPGTMFSFFGKVKVENGRVTMFHPSYSRADSAAEDGILPVYPLTSGLSQKDLRMCTKAALLHADELAETLPAEAVRSANLCSNAYALKNIHYPEGDDQYRASRYRLVYEELFCLDTALAISKDRGGLGRKGNSMKGDHAYEFVKTLPYELTGAQKRVLSEILVDMASEKAMNRLVQGDVGSGKTAVAAAAMVQSAGNGYQSAFMAPTDILARQHFATLTKLFSGLGVHVVLLTSGMPSAEKKEALRQIKDGTADIAVGTHALISEAVRYKDLGLVITDEQHRFGVAQRRLLSAKGRCPDVLVMTATPIPRTLAVVLYADLDVSVIDELPPGRTRILTSSYKEGNRKEAYRILLSEVRNGRQAYIVAPFIEDTESLEGRSAESLYEEFKSLHPDISCALLHGQMPQDEKDLVMQRFSDGEISVLISTVVIEVGIDIPNATVMLIENAERFGLAQMHQLRGRVGRGSYQSYCLIITGDESETSGERAKIMCSTSSGFVIAEKDLELRGPGEFFGYRQHGLPQLTLADPVKHKAVAEQALRDVRKMLESDPLLEKEENSAFRKNLQNKYMQSDGLTL